MNSPIVLPISAEIKLINRKKYNEKTVELKTKTVGQSSWKMVRMCGMLTNSVINIILYRQRRHCFQIYVLLEIASSAGPDHP